MTPCSVAVVMGGASPEFSISMKSGANVIAHLDPVRYRTRPVVILRDGSWYLPDHLPDEGELEQVQNGVRPEAGLAELNAWGIDVAYLALHGPNGEDGTVQGLFHVAGIPYTGSGIETSAVCMNKNLTRIVAAQEGVRIAPAVVLAWAELETRGAALMDKIVHEIGLPLYIKSLRSGSSLGVHFVEARDTFEAALDLAFQIDNQVLIEREIKGREITCGVLSSGSDGFKALPPVEIRSKHKFFDYTSKYDASLAEEICPAPIHARDQKRVMETSVALCRRVGTRGIARVDFILNEVDLWFLEINTIPGLTQESIVLKEARSVEMSLESLMEYPILAALESGEPPRNRFIMGEGR